MTPLRWFLLVLLIAYTGVFAWGHRNARADPVVRTLRIGFHDWPRGATPVRLLLASDVHIGNDTMDAARLARIVGRIDALAPDVVVLAGDFMAGHDRVVARRAAAAMVAPLSRLRAPLGVFAVLGNHDFSTEPELVQASLQRAGITVLENSAARAGPLAIVGMGDLFSQRRWDRTVQVHDEDRAIAQWKRIGGLPVALAHGDDRHYLGGRIRLLLDGHTHCQQIDLTHWGIRNPLMHIEHGCGPVRDRDGLTLTTAGLGTSVLPLRYNAPADMWVVTLGPVTPAAAQTSPASRR